MSFNYDFLAGFKVSSENNSTKQNNKCLEFSLSKEKRLNLVRELKRMR